MLSRIILAACLLLAAGCAAPTTPIPAITADTETSDVVPADAVALKDLGFENSPADFYVPAGAVIVDRVDQSNNVVVVLEHPAGSELAEFWRTTLPEQGWRITADGNDSLLFDRGELHGAFTVTNGLAAVTIRSDDRS